MPTVLKWGKTRVVIYLNDHPPGHVHILAPDRYATFWLHCPEGPPELEGAHGYRLAEINAVADRLTRALSDLCMQWENIHGYH
jgi:hypothetical protein